MRARMRDNNGMPVVEGRTVLIVEDSENSAAPLEIALLSIPGLSVLLAPSAFEALRILNGGNAAVGAIVTDLNMPRMDGYELIRRIRQNRSFSRTPIVVLSADGDPATPERVAQSGANAFFSKPYSPAEVVRKLEQLLNVERA